MPCRGQQSREPDHAPAFRLYKHAGALSARKQEELCREACLAVGRLSHPKDVQAQEEGMVPQQHIPQGSQPLLPAQQPHAPHPCKLYQTSLTLLARALQTVQLHSCLCNILVSSLEFLVCALHLMTAANSDCGHALQTMLCLQHTTKNTSI